MLSTRRLRALRSALLVVTAVGAVIAPASPASANSYPPGTVRPPLLLTPPVTTPTPVPVKPTPKAKLTAKLSARAAAVGKPITIAGRVTPAVAGTELTLLRYSDKTWRPVDTMTTDAAGAYRLTFRRPVTGYFHYRVVKPADRAGKALKVTLPRVEIYRVVRYSVRTAGNVTAPLSTFRSRAARTFADPRGWSRTHRRFVEVRSGGDFTLVLAQAELLPTYASICSVRYSCRAGRYVVINHDRWVYGSAPFQGSLTQYRQMVLNHETGHWLGGGHLRCSGAGAPAPVMQQQSKSMQGCKENAWPLAAEVRHFS